MTYNDLMIRYQTDSREIPTAPTTGAAPKWFRVYVRSNAVYVGSGRAHANACSVSPDRRLRQTEFEPMLSLYRRRRAGERVAQEAAAMSINASYWFGIFKDMDA